MDYNRIVRHTIRNTLIEVSNLSDEEKAAANQVEDKIDSLTQLFNANSCSPEQEEELAILYSGQQTYLDKGTEVGLDTVLDYTIKKVGNLTKTYQKELISNQENKLKELNNIHTSARTLVT